jgi:hypothetical protein
MKYRWLAAGCILLLCSCHSNVSQVDSQIDGRIRTQMYALNQEVLQGLGTKNPARIAKICSDSLWARDGKAISEQILNNKRPPEPARFKIRNQFYLHYSGGKDKAVVRRSKGNEHDYILTLQPLNAETAVTMGYFNDTPESFALTTAYGKYGDTWKLNILQLGLLKIMNGDAIDWYNKAQHDYERGCLADAGNDLLLCEQLMKPAGDFIHYEKEKEINDLDQKLTTAITQRYPFPLTDSLVKTRPSIFRISLYRTSDGYYPFVLYNTKLSLSDSSGLEKECNAVCARLGDLFKGLDEGKRFLFFRAYGQIPGDTSGSAFKEFRKAGKKLAITP